MILVSIIAFTWLAVLTLLVCACRIAAAGDAAIASATTQPPAPAGVREARLRQSPPRIAFTAQPLCYAAGASRHVLRGHFATTVASGASSAHAATLARPEWRRRRVR
jgi:hypothetical protein